MKTYSLNVRNRFLATLIILGLIGLGAAVLFVGFALVAGLAAAGAVIGTASAVYNRVRGRNPLHHRAIAVELDPKLEVFPKSDHTKLPPV